MRCFILLIFMAILGGPWRLVHGTCVLESEFGFTLNCAFKKSGLFRVRNLGGIKAHVGLGFTVGDELGFPESLSNVEGNRRRSTQNNRFQNALIAANAQKNANNRLTVVQPSVQPTQMQPQLQKLQPAAAASALNKTTNVQMAQGKVLNKMTVTVPPFKPIPPAQERPITSPIDRIMTMTAVNSTRPTRVSGAPMPALVGVAVPTFQAMPASISRISSTQNINNVDKPKPTLMAVVMNAAPIDKTDTDNKLASGNVIPTVELPTSLPQIQTAANSVHPQVQAFAAISNISMEAIEAAILLRQQQLMKQKAQQTTTTTPVPIPTHRTTTSVPKRPMTSSNKVMNAPKEYYPVGYDKNFDDNFASKVELPDTSFNCGDQKHFPGLYADEDLGCMVFHVCALTDDGLIMKSFLCPESTLFDMTILKCNWWFYVDCKNSKKLYDSNIPVSKSYQLMKALTFFSSYKNKESNAKN